MQLIRVNRGRISCLANVIKMDKCQGITGRIHWHLFVIAHVNLTESLPVFPWKKADGGCSDLVVTYWVSDTAAVCAGADLAWLISSESDWQKWQSTGVEDW